MMAFESMLVDAATEAGMKVPPESLLDTEPSFDKNEYPYFFVFCQLQLGRPIQWGEHWENAKIIASVPLEKLKSMLLEDYLALGLNYTS